NETEQVCHNESDQDEPGRKKHGRWNEVRAEMTDPSADDRGNSKYEGNEKDNLVVRDSNDSAQQHQGKQNCYNNIPAFDFFDKGEKEEKQRKCNEELHVGEATEPWYSQRLHALLH